MALFGKPRQLKQLNLEIMAARAALNMYDKLPPGHQQQVAATAAIEIRKAATVAAAAGHSEGARDILTAARAQSVNSSIANQWPGMVDEALGVL